VKYSILKADLAVEETLNPGGRGERFKLLDLTKKGHDLLTGYGIAAATGHGRGGVTHQWWAFTIATWLRNEGAEAKIEDASTGVRVDILATMSGHMVAVEIEMTDGHALENIRKDLSAGFPRIVCLLDSPSAEVRIRAKLGIVPEELTFGDLRDYQSVLAPVLSSLRAPNQNAERRRRRASAAPSRRPVEDTASPLFEPGAYSTPLAADYLGLSPATLETLRTRGGGPAFVKLGRRVVYSRVDLDAWLAAHKQRSTSDTH
jgi:hypothetical protein